MAEDPELEAVRRAITPGTTRSIKRTLCACLLIRAARRNARAPANSPPAIGQWKRMALAVSLTAITVSPWWHGIVLALARVRLLGQPLSTHGPPTTSARGRDAYLGGDSLPARNNTDWRNRRSALKTISRTTALRVAGKAVRTWRCRCTFSAPIMISRAAPVM
jgi:hypothetical protein